MKNVRKADRAVKERYLINRRGVFHKGGEEDEVEGFAWWFAPIRGHKEVVAAVAMERIKAVMVLEAVLGVYWG